MTDLKTKMQNKYDMHFRELISSSQGTSKKAGNKLRTYANMKSMFKIKSYLNSGLPKQFIRHIAAFRLSTHKLEIEIGRYHKPKPTPVDERICTLGKIENEVHICCLNVLRIMQAANLQPYFPYE